MTERTCGNCRWWNRHSGREYANDVGECRKHAPAASARHDDARWTTTWETDICGEWADKNITPEHEERRELVRRFAVAMIASGHEDYMALELDGIWNVAEQMADAEPNLITKSDS